MSSIVGDIAESLPTISKWAFRSIPIIKRLTKEMFKTIERDWDTTPAKIGRGLAGTASIPHHRTGGGGVTRLGKGSIWKEVAFTRRRQHKKLFSKFWYKRRKRRYQSRFSNMRRRWWRYSR